MAETRLLENLPQRTRDAEQGSRGSRLRFKYVTLLDVGFHVDLLSEAQNHGITAFPGHEDLLLSAYFPLLIFSSKSILAISGPNHSPIAPIESPEHKFIHKF